MKYIRTKDGRIIKESDIPEYYGGLVSSVGLDLDYEESDIIEDLCDAYVVIGIGGTKEIFIERNKLKLYEEHLKRFLIFGAIWTIKGLIFVAKMDWKGEWELI